MVTQSTPNMYVHDLMEAKITDFQGTLGMLHERLRFMKWPLHTQLAYMQRVRAAQGALDEMADVIGLASVGAVEAFRLDPEGTQTTAFTIALESSFDRTVDQRFRYHLGRYATQVNGTEVTIPTVDYDALELEGPTTLAIETPVAQIGRISLLETSLVIPGIPMRMDYLLLHDGNL